MFDGNDSFNFMLSIIYISSFDYLRELRYDGTNVDCVNLIDIDCLLV